MPPLIDTHVLLWSAYDSKRLSPAARAIMADPRQRPRVSLASAWEIHVKYGLGKLELDVLPSKFFEQQLSLLEVEILPIDLAHLAPLATMPLHHRDPFHRLLIAQSLVEGLPLVSADEAFDAYRELGVERIW